MDTLTSARLELAAETAREFGTLKIKVTGSSMLPSVFPGDILTVVHQPPACFRPGDIALAVRGGEFVAHRVVRTEGRQLITRGDSLPANDPPFEAHEILGRVIELTRNGRRIDHSITLGRWIAAWVLRRSELSTRVLLRLNRAKF